MRHDTAGYTLQSLLILIAVLAIFSAILFPTLSASNRPDASETETNEIRGLSLSDTAIDKIELDVRLADLRGGRVDIDRLETQLASAK